MHVPTRRSLAAAALIAAASQGCTYAANTRLAYAAAPLAAPPAAVSVAVVPLDDERPPARYPSQPRTLALAYIPLIPYVTASYERLDEARAAQPQERFPVRMAAAMADDLAQSRLVEQVRFVPAGAADADYVLGGRLRDTQFDVSATSYMLGLPGVLLWALPIPIGSNAAAVAIDLDLRDRGGTTVWRHALRGAARETYTLYGNRVARVAEQVSLEVTRYGGNDKGIDPDSLWAYHADALRGGMREAKRSLAAFLAGARAAAPR